MRVLLVSLNRLRFPYPVYPIGLDQVAAAISPPHEVRILDLCPLEPPAVEGAVAAAVEAFRPEAVGLSIRNIDNSDQMHADGFLGEMRAAVGAIRRATSAPLVLGGAGFTLYAAELMEALRPDCGLVGEAHRAPALFEALAAGRDVAGLPGVAVVGAPPPRADPPSGTLARAPRADPTANPALPFYLRYGGVLNLQTRRGCAFRCVYCSYPVIEGRASRKTPAQEAAEEAKRLEAAGARHLFITDSIFNGDPDHALEVADAFRAVGLKVPWSAYFAPLRPPDGFYLRMKEAGCSHVEFGTESLSPPMMKRMRKAFTPEHAFAAHRAAREAGMHLAHFFLLGGPDETFDTVDETLRNAERLDGAVAFFFCGMRIHPGTELERIARDAGQLAPGQSLLEPIFYQPPAAPLQAIEERLARHARGRPSWLVGSGSERAAMLARLYERGMSGPLWEHLV